MPETASPPRRFRVSIGELIGLVVVAALACVWPGLIPTEVVATVFYWLATRRDPGLARAGLVSLGMVLGSIYLIPLANFVAAPLLDPTIVASKWRQDWSPLFPIAPGAMPICLLGGINHLIGRLSDLRPHRRVVRPRLAVYGRRGRRADPPGGQVAWPPGHRGCARIAFRRGGDLDDDHGLGVSERVMGIAPGGGSGRMDEPP